MEDYKDRQRVIRAVQMADWQRKESEPLVRHSDGFTPDFTDTYKKAYRGSEECSCLSEENLVRSSNEALSSRRSQWVPLARK
jgi:hypothetical protein